MTYEEIIKANIAKFKGNEGKMWEMIGVVSRIAEKIKDPLPEVYWELMRETHMMMEGRHFNKDYAMWQVDQMSHKGEDGKIHKGEYWSIENASAVMEKYRNRIPAEYNKWDVYVALNSHYHDYCVWARRKFPSDYEAVIIEMAIAFWFNDDDWGSATKVWDYFDGKNKLPE